MCCLAISSTNSCVSFGYEGRFEICQGIAKDREGYIVTAQPELSPASFSFEEVLTYRSEAGGSAACIYSRCYQQKRKRCSIGE